MNMFSASVVTIYKWYSDLTLVLMQFQMSSSLIFYMFQHLASCLSSHHTIDQGASNLQINIIFRTKRVWKWWTISIVAWTGYWYDNCKLAQWSQWPQKGIGIYRGCGHMNQWPMYMHMCVVHSEVIWTGGDLTENISLLIVRSFNTLFVQLTCLINTLYSYQHILWIKTTFKF